MSKILALETATDACSCALAYGDDVIEHFEIAPRGHTEIILPMIAKLLATAEIAISDLDAIAFGQGPGSFTGVRVATSIAQGMALAHDLPVIPLSCLAILATGGGKASGCATVVPVMDARRAEIYSAIYHYDCAKRLVTARRTDAIEKPESLQLPTESYVVVGSGTVAYRAELELLGVSAAQILCAPLLPRASDSLELAKFALRANTTVAAEFAEPIYLRRAV